MTAKQLEETLPTDEELLEQGLEIEDWGDYEGLTEANISE